MSLALSSLSVVGNSNRLRRYRSPLAPPAVAPAVATSARTPTPGAVSAR